MVPHTFRDYWSGRGFAHELAAAGAGSGECRRAGRGALPRPSDPSLFEHLPDVLERAAPPRLVRSPVRAGGRGPGTGRGVAGRLPRRHDGRGRPSAAAAAARRRRRQRLETARRELCRRVLAAHQGSAREARLDELTSALTQLAAGIGWPPSLSRAALLLTDRRRPCGRSRRPTSRPSFRRRRPGRDPARSASWSPATRWGSCWPRRWRASWRPSARRTNSWSWTTGHAGRRRARSSPASSARRRTEACRCGSCARRTAASPAPERGARGGP